MAQSFPNLDFPFTQQNLITDPWRAFLRVLWERTGGASGGVSVPTGQGALYFGTAAPDGWLLCDGAAVSRSIYFNLYGKIGTTWGSGDGFSTFNLPDLRQRFALGSIPSGADTVGAYGGANEIALTTNQLPIHTHALTSKGHFHGITDPGHLHTLTDPGHVHGVTDPEHLHTISDPGHAHTIGSSVTPAAGLFATQSATNTGNVTTDMASTGITVDPAATGISIDSNITAITVDDAFTGITQTDVADAFSTIGTAGKGQAFSIKPSYAIVNYIIKT